MENIDIELIKTSRYSNEVIWAVRYGYQYRQEVEKYAEDDCQLRYCLTDPSSFLLWLGDLVIAGVIFDVIKKRARILWDKLMSMKMVIPEDVDRLLLDEDELRKFVTYVSEFKDKKISATAKQTDYIREEIIADYVGETAGEIWTKEKRQPTKEEWLIIFRDANRFANELLES